LSEGRFSNLFEDVKMQFRAHIWHSDWELIIKTLLPDGLMMVRTRFMIVRTR